MKKVLLATVACLSVLIWITPLNAQYKKGTLPYFLKLYQCKTLTESEEPLIAQANEVFARVAAAADKPSDRYPKLVVFETNRSVPHALCIQDGSILLHRSGLKSCFIGVPQATGSARLAFVIGHEIAHLTERDFWHAELADYMALSNSAPGAQSMKLIKNQKIRWEMEHRADCQGMLNALMAGYDPRIIIQEEGIRFFESWSQQISGQSETAPTSSHPAPDNRRTRLKEDLKTINSWLTFFELGIRLYHKGDYDSALRCMEYIKSKFPSREVLNNIGLIHLQKALDSLSGFDQERARRFKLATILDPEIRTSISRGNIDRPKIKLEKAFKKEIEEAIFNFEEASSRDVHYVPALVNLASAYILNLNSTEALAALEKAEALKKTTDIDGNSPDVMSNMAIAFYLFGKKQENDFTKKATGLLTSVLSKDPEHTASLYNLGSVLLDQNRLPEAKEYWRRYIKIEPKGRFAERVRLFLPNAERDQLSKKRPNHYQSPAPIPIEPITKKNEKQLESFIATPLEELDLDGVYYIKGELRVLVVRMNVKLVEFKDDSKTNLYEILESYGRPNRSITNASGLKTLVYDEFALDIRENKVIKVVYY